MPSRTESGRPVFVIRECITWREEQIRKEERGKADEPTGKTKKLSGLNRKLEAEAKLKELELREREGEVADIEVMHTAVDKVIGLFASTAAGQLQRFERDIVRTETPGGARRLTQEIHRALMAGAHQVAEILERGSEGGK